MTPPLKAFFFELRFFATVFASKLHPQLQVAGPSTSTFSALPDNP